MNDGAKRQGVPAASAERRQVTVIFADMVGFTEISESLGAEATFALIEPINELMAGAVKEHGGTVKDFTGDGIMALFGAPDALEDAPLRACRAGLAINDRLAAACPAIEAKYGVRPRLRVGVNSGLAVVARNQVGRGPVGAFGDTVNLASRLQALAEPGTVYLSEATHRLVEGLVDAIFAGVYDIKGKSDPQRVYRLEAVREGRTRFDAALGRGLSVLVGREREMDALQQAFMEARDTLRVVDLAAEAGIGKSRLIYEFCKLVQMEQAFVLTGNCSADGRRTPFGPFIEMVRRSFHLAAGQGESDVARKLENGLRALGLSDRRNLGLLLNLLGLQAPAGALEGLDGAMIGLHTRELLERLLRSRCRLSRVVLVIEDLHWIDRASEEVLGKIVDLDPKPGLLILHTRRPEYAVPWRGRPVVLTFDIEPLASNEINRLVQTRLAVDALPDALVRLVTEKAEGNALFAEEIVSFLTACGRLRVSDGHAEFDSSQDAPPLPASIQSLLAARVEAFGPEDRKWLQIASVVGRQFDVHLLAAVAEESENLESWIAAAQSADLVRRDSASGDLYFKHVLVRDAIYDSMLQTQRADLHLKVAREIERRRANQLIEAAEILAHHYSLTPEAEQAFKYMALAGRKCLNIYSLDEAEKHFRQALALYEQVPSCAEEQEMARAAANLLETVSLKGDILEAKRLSERYIPRLEAFGPSPELVSALYVHSQILFHQCEFERGESKSLQALQIAEGLGDVRAIGYARAGLMFCSTVLGRWTRERAAQEGAELVAASEQAGDNYLLNWAYWSVAWDYIARGLLVEARTWVDKLIESGLQRDDRRALGMAYWTLSWINLTVERIDEAVENAAECRRAAATPFDRVAGVLAQITVELFTDRAEAALPQLEKQQAWAIENGWLYSASGLDCAIGPTVAFRRNFREGIRLLERAIDKSDRYGDAYVATWNRIMLAEIYLGVIAPSGAPAPPGFVRKNLGALFIARVVGARRASALLEKAASNRQLDERGILIARINYDRALLLKRTRRLGLARERLLTARESAEAQGAGAMLARIDAALTALPPAAKEASMRM